LKTYYKIRLFLKIVWRRWEYKRLKLMEDNMKLGQEVDWQEVGAALAHADDGEQAECLKAFIKECKTWGTHYAIEQQLASVNFKLTQEEREILAMLGYTKDV